MCAGACLARQKQPRAAPAHASDFACLAIVQCRSEKGDAWTVTSAQSLKDSLHAPYGAQALLQEWIRQGGRACAKVPKPHKHAWLKACVICVPAGRR